MYAGEPSPGGLLPMMTYEGSFSPKGVCFRASGITKG